MSGNIMVFTSSCRSVAVRQRDAVVLEFCVRVWRGGGQCTTLPESHTRWCAVKFPREDGAYLQFHAIAVVFGRIVCG